MCGTLHSSLLGASAAPFARARRELLPLSSSYARQLVEVDATPCVVVLPSAKNSMVPRALAVMVPAVDPSTAAFLCYRWHSCLPI